MKKLLSTALISSAILANYAFADGHAITEKVYVSGGGAGVIFDGDRNMEDPITPWGAVGFQFTEKWAAELNYIYSEADVPHAKGSTEFDIASLLAIHSYKGALNDGINARVGLAKYNFGGWPAGSEEALRAGIGYDKYLDNNLAVRVFVDALYSFDDGEMDFVPGIGLKYSFGGQSKASSKPVAKKKAEKAPEPKRAIAPKAKTEVAPMVKDGDNDGIIDAKDMCPNTAANISVDSRGCELDSDNDGVVNSKDRCVNTPRGAKVDSMGCRVQLEEVINVNLNIQFANNSLAIDSKYHDELASVAKYMKRYPDADVEIQGHTDSIGSAAYNQKLSEKRAQAVVDYIEKNFKVNAAKIVAKGYGEKQPIADNMVAAGRAKNRRVVAVIK
ncbi:hypothetical protein C2869_12470 [Saccharobesus litoralis]|uniref:OmpA-like domain-containing protein n=1 Tax=Saccharobesus litoralis TaxID=2172099 RepID=A0A2S0VSL6_9ALTE|nr:OmpA family protein [Saccharobesus litoralis]AWB67199.1 hypothetical protein C2869_12470 [Saccharobesus litoralis]